MLYHKKTTAGENKHPGVIGLWVGNRRSELTSNSNPALYAIAAWIVYLYSVCRTSLISMLTLLRLTGHLAFLSKGASPTHSKKDQS